MDIFEIFEELLTDDEEDFINIVEQPRRNRVFSARPNYIETLNHFEFVQRFRISKHSVQEVLFHINNLLERETNRNHAIEPLTQILITLRFYACGSMIIVAADFGGIHESTASTIIKHVSNAIAGLAQQFIRLPQEPEEIQQIKNGFFKIAKFPHVIGAIDCTHIKIQSPGGCIAENFRNRKGWFSFNVQTVSDPSLKITDIVARWPGSTADRTIFASSRLKARFDEPRYGNSFLLGDSGYTLNEYLMIPLQNPQQRAEQLYNESHIRTRNVVERQYGVWKRRFQILRLEMRVKLDTVMAIIVATAVLHNIAINNNDPEPEYVVIDEPDEDVNANVFLNGNQNGRDIRQNLINDYFTLLI